MVQRERRPDRRLAEAARGYARGALGAILVSIPLLATMEMWWLGFTMPPWKMLLFLIVNFGVLIVLEYYSGMREDSSFMEEVIDALGAYGIGFVVGAAVLYLFDNLGPGMSTRELVGKITLQSIPLSVGASIAMSQLGGRGDEKEERKRQAGMVGSVGISLAGAFYFGFNIAPTAEPMLLGLSITPWHGIGLIVASLVVSHAIVYSLGFAGARELPEGSTWWRAVLTYGTATVAISMLVAAYLLWTFGRIGPDTAIVPTVSMVVVLGFVNSFGAAAAKLIL